MVGTRRFFWPIICLITGIFCGGQLCVKPFGSIEDVAPSSRTAVDKENYEGWPDTEPVPWEDDEKGYPCPTTRQNRPTWIHYHIQHNAGTALFQLARENGECAPRICQQRLRECFVSYNEREEARAVSISNITYTSYEAMLPRQFPMPFVSPDVRAEFYFTTIIRDPIDRLKSTLRHTQSWRHLFYADFSESKNTYHADNLIVRWLAGVQTSRPITSDDTNVAKCRLKLFDLVMTDETIDKAVENILCPRRGMAECRSRPKATVHSASGPDPLDGVDPVAIGAWIERHRPSYEVYDYARYLAMQAIFEAGDITAADSIKTKPTVVKAFAKYLSVKGNNSVPPLPPKEPECDELFHMWSNGPDKVPLLLQAIGALGKGPAVT